MSKNIVGGVGAVTVNGRRLLARAGVKYRIGGDARETVEGVDTIHGFKVAQKSWMASFDASTLKETDLVWLKEQSDATVLLELRNGRSVQLSEAWQVGDLEVDAVEGQVSVTFESRDGSVE